MHYGLHARTVLTCGVCMPLEENASMRACLLACSLAGLLALPASACLVLPASCGSLRLASWLRAQACLPACLAACFPYLGKPKRTKNAKQPRKKKNY